MKQKIMKFFRSYFKLVPLLIAAVVFTSCVSTPVGKQPPRWKEHKVKAKTFAPITDHDLWLLPISERLTFFAGEEVPIDFKLINKGERQVKIDEWLQDQDANIEVYYCPWQEQQPEFKPEEWTCFQSKKPDSLVRFPLELNPGNSVLVSCNLTFIKKMTPPATPQKFYIIARLTLKSLPLVSEVLVITVK